MKLIKLQIEGFKTFPYKTSLEFDGGLVGIIGPNGSGKSNITDAIKWVLGETSIKNLRGDSMQDVIFKGSKNRKKSLYAKVTLTFENDKKNSNLPEGVFTISRQILQDKKENKYLINGRPALAKNLKEIAMESGISKSSLSIISQGTVSKIAECNPEERRIYFEELASVSKYKKKRKESNLKLEKVAHDLSSIRNTNKIKYKNLLKLKQQVEKVKKFQKTKKKLESLEKKFLIFKIKKNYQLISDCENIILNLTNQKNFLINNYKAESLEVAKSLEKKEKFKSEIIELENQIKTLESRIKNFSGVQSYGLKFENNNFSDQDLEGKIEQEIKQKELELREIFVQEKNFLDEKKSIDEKVLKNELDISKIEKEVSTLKKFQLQNFVLKSELIKKIASFSNSKNFASDYIQKHSSFFSGFKGLVKEKFFYEEKYQKIMSFLFKNVSENIIVDNEKTAIKMVSFLKNNKAGKANFIPLSSIKSRRLESEKIYFLEGVNGFLGVASDFLENEPEFDLLKNFLFGNVIVADNIENAELISKKTQRKNLVISFAGDLVKPGGIIFGGYDNFRLSSVEIEKNKLEKVEENIKENEAEIETKEQELLLKKENAKKNIELLNLCNIKKSEINFQKTNVLEKIDDLKIFYEKKFNKNLNKNSANENYYLDLDIIVEEKTSLEKKLQILKVDLDFLDQKIVKVKNIENNFYDEENSFSEKIEKNKIKKQKLLSENEFFKKDLLEKYQINFDINQSFNKLENDQFIKINFDYFEKEIFELKKNISEMGNINFESVEDYEKQNADFEKDQVIEKEISESKKNIEKSIEEMDRFIEKKMYHTFQEVSKNFSNIFSFFFNGGSGQIKLLKPQDILNSGVEIEANLPGKVVKNIKLFSGGEKALIVICLLFSMLKTRSLPLCILDEVEAALDEYNLVKYVEFLHKIKEKTQFLIITHREGTMARMDKLIGVTMKNEGITSVYKVDLNEIREQI